MSTFLANLNNEHDRIGIGQVYEEDCVNDVDDDLADHDDDHPGRVKEWVIKE